jgi:hypothetical protein
MPDDSATLTLFRTWVIPAISAVIGGGVGALVRLLVERKLTQLLKRLFEQVL